jgi:hypothetical protein
MKQDEYGEVINHGETYREIAQYLAYEDRPVLIGWTDQEGTHFDIMFVVNPIMFGTNIQGGLKQNDLFVGVMRQGIFGFIIKDENTHHGYIAEKLGMSPCVTTEKLAELINGVKKELINQCFPTARSYCLS